MRFFGFGYASAVALFAMPIAAIAQDEEGSDQAQTDAPGIPGERADQERLEADVRFLADDKLQGREAGTPGYDLAAGYVAGKFSAMNLTPAGDDGTYFQSVPIIGSKLIFSEGAAVNIRDAKGADILSNGVAGVDFFTFPRNGEMVGQATGELVFVGHGFASDSHKQDDFSGIDLTGKIAVILRGAPSSLESEERAHFSATTAERLSERGAIGSITVLTEQETAGFPFDLITQYFTQSTFMTWADKDGNAYSPAPAIRATTWLSPAMSEALFEDQAISWSDIEDYQIGVRASLPSFTMGLTASMVGQSDVTRFTSNNVLAMIPGTDPAVASEYVVVTAHLDHTGVQPTEADGDDEIYNGAMDNATGVASMLEVARMIKANPARRPVIFLALTAEEQGLVGSDYFARNPNLGGGKVVANINLDMPILTFPFSDVVPLGAERSNMFAAVKEAAASKGIAISEDPAPEENNFVRSDQYSFVQQGIPAIYLLTGWANGGAAAELDFLGNHYHRASDEVSRVDFTQLRRFAEVNYAITRNVANMADTPAWKKGDFFGKTFDGLMAEAE